MKSFWLEPRTIVAYAVSLLALAEIVDLTIVAVAIPHMMGSLNANLSEISLTMTSYIVAAAVCIPLTGLVIRKFGMRKLTLVSGLVFGIASVFCGLSTSLNQMILFRLIQGAGGAFLPSIAQSYIARSFSPQEQGKIMTVYSLCIVMGPIIGPVFGGTLTENFDWRWCFYVNVPICLIGLGLVWLYMKNEPTAKVKIDYISFAFMAAGVAFLEYFIDEGNTNNWFDSLQMVTVLVVAVLLLFFFVWRAYLGKSVINLVIFKNPNFILCCLTIFLFMVLASASLAYYPTMLQQSFGYPVDTAGYITAPRGLVAFIAAPIIARLLGYVDPRKIMFFGLFCFAMSCFMISNYAPSINKSYIICSMLIQGIGMMAFFIPIMQIVFIDVPAHLHSDVSGVFNFFRNIASSVGTSLSATIVSHQMQVTYHDMAAHVSPYSRGYLWWSQHLLNQPPTIKITAAQLNILKQGSLISYLDSFFLFGSLLLLILWLPLLLKKPLRTGAPLHID